MDVRSMNGFAAVLVRIFINGFSAGGMFAQRYALLHPGRVKEGAGELSRQDGLYGHVPVVYGRWTRND